MSFSSCFCPGCKSEYVSDTKRRKNSIETLPNLFRSPKSILITRILQEILSKNPADRPDSLSVTISPPLYSEIPGTVPLNDGPGGGSPPSYEDVVNPEASPPSYQSLFGQVREARKNSNSNLEFLRKLVILLLGTIGCTIMLGVAILIPTSMVVIGTHYFGQCKVEQFIPVYLIVGGTFGIFKNLLQFFARCRKNEDDEECVIHRSRENILDCFLLAWFITGCIWIYRVYEPEYEDENSPFYCNKTLYLFAFWLVTSTFILLAIFFICFTCIVVSTVVTSID